MRLVQKKVCLLGEFAVGKTSLVRQFVEGQFDDKYLSSIGVKISRKPMQREGYALNLLIWDLAGGDIKKPQQSRYLRGAVGALLVCDLTRVETLAAIPEYVTLLQTMQPRAALVLIGNKADLANEQVVSLEMLRETAVSIQAAHTVTSAKTGENIDHAFDLLAEKIEANS